MSELQKARSAPQALRAHDVDSREALLSFVQAVRLDWEARPERWCNARLDVLVEAVMLCIDRADARDEQGGRVLPRTPSWRDLARALLTARRCVT